MNKAIDISYHNGVVNLKRVRDEGDISFVMIRAGYGKNNIDQKFTYNAQQAVNLNMPAGIYWFSYATTMEEARKEGEYAVEGARKYWKSTYICFDLEYDTIKNAAKKGVSINGYLATSMAIEFLNEVVKAGYTPVLYLNKDYKQRMFDMTRINNAGIHPLIWYARYCSEKKLATNELDGVWMWQYSSIGAVPGCTGKVDVNYIYKPITLDQSAGEKNQFDVNLFIKSFQIAANADGAKIETTGTDTALTQAYRKTINLKAVRVSITPFSYRYAASPEITTKHSNVIKWFQQRAKELGCYNKEIDGKYGPNSRTACLKLQKKFKLKEDGIAGYNTLSTLFYN